MKPNILLLGKFVVVVALAAAFCLVFVQTVNALEGPTQSPPMGLVFEDSDTGGEDDKEQWGREEGRDFTFTLSSVSSYDELLWQPLDVKLAFDGAIDEPGETLVLQNSVAGPTMTYRGQADLQKLIAGSDPAQYETTLIETEFVLTAQDEVSSAPIVFQLIDGKPTINLKNLTANLDGEVAFTAHLAFRAQMPDYATLTAICTISPVTGNWYGALNVYDCTHTDPVYDRPALTTFDHGFFYEIPAITLLEHDVHMEQLVSGVKDTVDDTNSKVVFLFDDWNARIPDLSNKIDGLEPFLLSLQQAVNDLGASITGLYGRFDQQDAALAEVESKLNNLPEMWLLLYLFGFEEMIPPDTELPEQLPALDEVLQMSQWYQQQLDIQVKDFGSVSGNKKESGTVKHFIVLMKVDGIPQEGAVVTSIDAIVDGREMSVVPIDDFTATELGGGLYEVAVPLPKSLAGEKVFLLEANYTENPDSIYGPDTIYGSVLFNVGQHTE